MRVLLLGADGFIGRHILAELTACGAEVICAARRPERLREMGHQVLPVDLRDPECHDPAFWRDVMAGDTHVVNCAGLLKGSEAAFEAVHVAAPRAIYQAMSPAATGLLVSAVGVEADTPFGHWRQHGEALARSHDLTILRPGLVLGETSYGGSSLLRALAACPGGSPCVGGAQTRFNPIHAADLAKCTCLCLQAPPGAGPQGGAWDIGGPETLSQAALIRAYRAWLGLPGAPVWAVPDWLAMPVARLGDWARLGPINTTALAQLRAGVEADGAALNTTLGLEPRGLSQWLAARPAGTQDLWQARLYLIRPLVRLCLCVLWLVSGLSGLVLSPDSFLPRLASDLPAALLIGLGRLGGLADLALALALFRNWRPRLTGWAQMGMVAGYTLGLSLIAPHLWADPFGALLKNLPILVLILIWMVLEEER